MIGTTLDGKYRIDRLVGAGAMGSVFEGEHTATGRRVAIKVISGGEVIRDRNLVARFQREAKAAGAIDTQHITQVLDAGEDANGAPYLVMELLQGEDLQHIIKRLGPLAPDLALRVVAQACLGLTKAHEAGVVHRDMKPANLFLARREAGERIVKLLDFGIAKVKLDHANDEESNALTKTGSMLGSPLYMSPEQAKGLKTIDHRADIWSTGIVLYQALSGRTPFDHCDALGGLIIAICHEDVTPVQDHAPWIPRELAYIVHKALQREPADRFQTAAEMLAAIKQFLPNGWTITEEMFTPLSETVRSSVAPRLSLAPQSMPHGSIPPPRGSMPPPRMPSLAPPGGSIPPPRSVPPPPMAPESASASGGAASTTSPGTLSQSMPGTTPPSRLPVIIVAGMAVVAAAAAAGLWVTRPKPPPPAPAAIETTAAAPPATTPAAPVTAPPTQQPKPVETAAKRVSLVILPSDASAEVEGVKTPLKGGVLEIKGAPGSVRRVRIFKGKSEVTTDVIITESGASPPKIDLAAGAKP